MDEVNYQSSTKHLNLLPLPPLWENKRIGPLIYCQLSFIFLTCESVIMIWVEALSQRNYLILQEIWYLPPPFVARLVNLLLLRDYEHRAPNTKGLFGSMQNVFQTLPPHLPHPSHPPIYYQSLSFGIYLMLLPTIILIIFWNFLMFY